MTADPFGTEALRRAVVDAWRSSPTRRREDANLEEDHARGYYRDRVVVELAQNAADAATRAGVPGEVTFRLDATAEPATLQATNTGTPLDAAGVASLASLRASSKGAGSVGRFGVGFAAVRSVSDDVSVRSASGGVRFAEPLAREAAGGDGPLAVLRLPFPAPPVPGDTVVELVLRDAGATGAVRAQLDAVDDALLLALPGLARVVVEVVAPDGVGRRTLDDVASRWTTRRASGELTPADVADLPTEQQRTPWSLTWALPHDPAAARGTTGVLHSPTATEVPLAFPALLVATFPVDPGRRRVLPGAATDRIAAEAGRAYAALLAEVAPARGAEVLALVPTGLPTGEVDAAVRQAALEALATAPLLPGRVAPRDAVVVAGAAGEDDALADVLGTVALPVRFHGLARQLGASVVPLADALDGLPAGMAPERWHAVYAALAPHVADAAVREALSGAPVPLADGRVARGVRGLVLPGAGAEGSATGGDDPVAEAARTLGVRLVHPDAAHAVLERVGAVHLDPRALLADPQVRGAGLAAAEALLDDAGDLEAREVVAAALELARAALDAGGEGLPFWLGELPVRTADGDLAALRETALPGTWAADALDALAVVGEREVDRYGEATLEAAGAHAGLDVYTVRDAVTPALDGPEDDEDGEAAWLADWSEYLEHLAGLWGSDVLVDELAAVADLDAVADDAWPDALRRIAAGQGTRAALVDPVLPGAGARPGAAHAPSYTAWWLRRHLGAPFALHDGVPLLPPPPEATRGLDEQALRALGGVGSLDESGPGDWPQVLAALGPRGTQLPVSDALAVWRGLAALAVRLDPDDRLAALDPLPAVVPALRDGQPPATEDAEDVTVAPGRRWAQLGAVVPATPHAAEALAELLDLPLAVEQRPDADGDPRDVPAPVTALDPRLPALWRHHDDLTVAGTPVRFWVHDGEAHATDESSLADALADLLEDPSKAALLREALADPAHAAAAWAVSAWS
ncbi:MAG: ATP-binding protein [Promicromonosporaceae bacterium]|nr:ATP-binding protein [Promicromonosporaceae bacterium]